MLSPYQHVPLGNRISPYMVPSLLSSQCQYTAPIVLPEPWQHLRKISSAPQYHPHKLIRCEIHCGQNYQPQSYEDPIAGEQLGHFLCLGLCHQIWKETGLWHRLPALRAAIWKCVYVGSSIGNSLVNGSLSVF